MPGTSIAFTVAAFGMIGLPPTAGFISKWQLGLGALDSSHPWVVAVLLVSSLLNALYFLPVIYSLWFREPELDQRAAEPRALLVPTLSTTAMVIIFGVAASTSFLPLGIAEQIAAAVFAP
jgi:multicomponent Na+:H+ antiporter subunit D